MYVCGRYFVILSFRSVTVMQIANFNLQQSKATMGRLRDVARVSVNMGIYKHTYLHVLGMQVNMFIYVTNFV